MTAKPLRAPVPGMRRRATGPTRIAIALAIAAAFAAPLAARAEGEIERGARLYRACVACHALEPGLHLTGPSLDKLWNRPAGRAEGFVRYSAGLRDAGFLWDRVTLDVWLANPAAMVGGTTMSFPGIPDAASRADLIAFLERAGGPDGAAALVAEGVIPAAFLRAQAPDPLSDAPQAARVRALRHCGDGYEIETADGARGVLWEKNLRLKIDSTGTGPPPGVAVILGAGMQGDRYTLVFASVADLEGLLEERCTADGSGETKP